jgi:hypothetical protein
LGLWISRRLRGFGVAIDGRGIARLLGFGWSSRRRFFFLGRCRLWLGWWCIVGTLFRLFRLRLLGFLDGLLDRFVHGLTTFRDIPLLGLRLDRRLIWHVCRLRICRSLLFFSN